MSDDIISLGARLGAFAKWSAAESVTNPVPDALTDQKILRVADTWLSGHPTESEILGFARQVISAAQSNTVPQGGVSKNDQKFNTDQECVKPVNTAKQGGDHE